MFQLEIVTKDSGLKTLLQEICEEIQREETDLILEFHFLDDLDLKMNKQTRKKSLLFWDIHIPLPESFDLNWVILGEFYNHLLPELPSLPLWWGALDVKWPWELLKKQIQELIRRKDEQQSTEELLDEMGEMSKRVQDLLGPLRTNLDQVKELHLEKSPLRKMQLKGVSLYSKYKTGEKPGGEFFDIVVKQETLLLYLSSTDTYLLSALMISEFGHIAKQKNFSEENLGQAVRRIRHNLSQFAASKARVDLLLMKLCLKTLELDIYSWGEFAIVDQGGPILLGQRYPIDENFMEIVHTKTRVHPGQRPLILSSGLMKNMKYLDQEEKFLKEITPHFEKTPEQMMNHLFFLLTKKLKKRFLYDASGLLFKVNKNVLYKV